ncbi:hypothetical protein H6G76_28065 [Nostoc sp. FACHB-152]|nr:MULTISPECIES: hypothetical protein [unclassified Nostoc]MBD2450915.1 hypothetical protein [Nostoc sp. FACHB-152]MBD2471275.1 hypothetical protein [Nostoc sp. FACHB-145]
MELSEEKTLLTYVRDDTAQLLSYEIYILLTVLSLAGGGWEQILVTR